jgi:ABC-type multidrug transport system fused ATPase/permease subunit
VTPGSSRRPRFGGAAGFFRPRASDSGVVAAAPAARAREVARRFWPQARPELPWMVVGLGAALVLPLVEAAQIWLFKLLVDGVLVPGDPGPLPAIVGVSLGLVLVAGLVSFADDYVAALVGERVVLRLRSRAFAHLLRISPDAIDRRRSGDLVTRVTGDVQSIETLMLSGPAAVLSAGVRLVVFGVLLVVIDWRLALVSLVVAPPLFLLARRFSRLARGAAREKRRRTGALGAVAGESLGNAGIVQASNAEGRELARFRREGEAIMDAELAATRIQSAMSPLVDLLEFAAVMAVVAAGTWAVAGGGLTVGGLLAFMAYLSQMYSPVRDLSSLATSLFSALAGAERVMDLLDEEPSVTDRPGALSGVRVSGAIEIDAVTFRYPGATVPALEEVDLAVAPGEAVAVVGPSGAGKSTLARLLLRFYDPGSGALRLDGHDLRDLTLACVRDNVAVVMQETLVFHGTVRDNVRFGRPHATDGQIAVAAEVAGLDRMVRDLPGGWDTLVGERGRHLSGGQRQRVAIARALLRDAPVLVLDEPTTGLDPLARAELIPALRELMLGRTSLVITHDMDLARTADRIVTLSRGRVLGEPAAVGA